MPEGGRGPRHADGRAPLVVAAGASRNKIFSARLAGLALEERGPLAATVALGLAIALTYFLQALLVASVLDDVFSGGSLASVLPAIAVAAALVIMRSLLITVREGTGAGAAVRIIASLRRRLFRKLLSLGPGWLSRTRTGIVQATVVDGAESLDAYFRLFLSQALVSVITAIAVVTYVTALDPVVGLIVLASAAAVVFAPTAFYRIMGRRAGFWRESYRPLAAEYLDNMQGMSTLKAFGASRERGRALAAKADEVCAGAIALNDISSYQYAIMALATVSGSALSLGVAAFQVYDGTLPVSSLLVILLLVRECFRPVAELQNALHFSVTGMYAGQSAFDILDAPEPVTGPVRLPGPAAAEGSWLSFEDVSFGYEHSGRLALDCLSFWAEPGQTIALVGRSGAGKSTVVNLLLRFFDPESGRIVLAGSDVRDWPLDLLRNQVSVVSQDTYLFRGTVAENLRMARPGANIDDLEAAARVAHAHDFITAMPSGYDTMLGERGLTLSGGQRQRLSIARAVLKDAPFLVLDEATSSIDVAAEAAIQAGLDATGTGRTTLIIAHRLSAVRRADRIIVLDRGHVAEAGTHDELIASPGAYAQLVAAQAAEAAR